MRPARNIAGAAERFEVELDIAPTCPTASRPRWPVLRLLAEEAAGARPRRAEAARHARAQVERMTRQLARLRGLPPGKSLALSVSLWQLGDAFWVFLEGEYYQLLQRQLRERFAETPIMVTTVTDGWLPGYVPTAETYGRGIYQESIAVVAPGSLERLIEALAARIETWADA